MSRKHYQLVADVLKTEVANTYHAASVERIAAGLADVFQQDNERFDRGRFYAACGLTSAGQKARV